MLQKERRRKQRSSDDHGIDAAVRRSQWRAAVAPLALGVLVLAGVTVAMLRGGNAAPPRTEAPRDAVLSDAAFGPHYDGLLQRRRAAHVPTMMQTMGSRVHFHPVLKVFVNDKPVTVPANIGIDPRAPGMQMAGLHTHDATGTIHVEGVRGARLGQFFAIWGVPFSARRLGPYRTGAGRSVRMWVDGQRSTAFGALALADGQRIVVSFGPTRHRAPE